jgi:hypothetical protein
VLTLFGKSSILISSGWGKTVTIERASVFRAYGFYRPWRRSELLGSAGALALGLAIALSPSAASAKIGHKATHKEMEHASKEPFGDIPKGPLQIVVSINQQKLHLYSDGTHIADTSVATGVPHLPTPTGVFSVIEKDRFHHSNIYSNAPMPFMQRITWSGVALHEGENIGHPASHGCIRMPHDFAARLWTLTKIGVRVIVARDELKPVPVADAHLFVHKDVPPVPVPPPAAADGVKTAQTIDNTKTTDAGNAPKIPAPAADAAKSESPKSESPKAETVASAAPKAEAAASEAPKADAAASEPPKSEAAQSEVPKSDAPDTTAAPSTTASTAEAPNAEPPHSEAANNDAPAATEVHASDPSAASPNTGSATPVVAAEPEPVPLRGAVVDVPPPAAPPSVAPPAQAVPAPPAMPSAFANAGVVGRGPIAIFISRKEKKIYVRQHFSALFDAPVTIDRPELALGTHVFTAMEYLDDGATFRWNVVSFPAEPPKAARKSESSRKSEKHARGRRRDVPPDNPVVAIAPPQTPEEVLARIGIPQDAIERISELMVPGSSLVVSDQGLGEETGEGTDFIVVTR